MRLLPALIAASLLSASVVAARDNGQWQQKSAADRQWFRDQRSPKTGSLCCSEADGVEAEEDIRQGHCWARWKMAETTTEWIQVPDDVVIKTPNMNLAPIVWWWYEQGKLSVRCFAPGGGV